MGRIFGIFSILFVMSSFNYSVKPPILKVDDLVKRYSNKRDTTYIINFWATWCAPCVAELPFLEAVNSNYFEEKVKVILVSLDFREDYDKKLVPFIEKRKIRSEVVMLDETNGSYFIPKIHKDWGGAIPSTMIINNTKNFTEFHEVPVTYEVLDNAVKKCR